MGTRNLTVVIQGGKPVVAQYGQWDGYPEGQGETIRSFLAEETGRAKFEAALKRCRFVTDQEVKDAYKEAGADGSGFVTMEVSERFQRSLPFINRDLGGSVLALIRESSGEVVLQDQYDFAADSLFCEWAYVVDLDQNTFEVYQGFNKEPLAETERFFPLEKLADGGYHPVKLVQSWFLDALPSKTEFLAEIKLALGEDDE